MTNTTPEWWIKGFSIIDQKLIGINHSIDLLQKEIKLMALDLTALTAQVAATETVEASAVTAINELVQELKSYANDPAAIMALATRLENSTGSLAAAIAAVPPKPAPAPAPTPTE